MADTRITLDCGLERFEVMYHAESGEIVIMCDEEGDLENYVCLTLAAATRLARWILEVQREH